MSEKLNGPLAPENTMAYLDEHPETVIIQVCTPDVKYEEGFHNALWIPHSEMAERFEEIPSGKPVLLHCRKGVACSWAYETLSQKRPDLELGYIAGVPDQIMEEYNEKHPKK